MKKKSWFYKSVLPLCALCFGLSACQMMQPGRPLGPKTVSVVSATPSHRAYQPEGVVAAKEQESYERALVSAKMEDAQEEALLQARADLAYDEMRTVNVKTDSALAWGTPPDSVGLGVTLLDLNLRGRLNDALATTPVNGEARWNVGHRQFVFMPNSDIYEAYRSGGQCRDGVFVYYGGAREEKVRGLFCRQGIGADWFLIK